MKQDTERQSNNLTDEQNIPDTKTLVEKLQGYSDFWQLPIMNEATDRLISLSERIQELESLAETDYLHQAMESQKRIAELERELAKCHGNNLAGNPYEWSHQALIDGLGGQLTAERAENLSLKDKVQELESQRDHFQSEATRLRGMCIDKANGMAELQSQLDEYREDPKEPLALSIYV